MRTLEKRLRAAGIALVFSSTTWVGIQVAHAQSAPPPTLNGETLTGTTYNSNSSQCNSDGSGTFTYSASGTATGPYSGTFTETGTATVNASGNITNYSENFTINSTIGTVNGTQTIIPNTLGTIPDCFTQFFYVRANYQATISTPGGNYTDQGQVTNDQTGFTGIENFTSSQTQTTPTVPTSKEQCKDDGWKNYPQFKNQGQCIDYVNHE